MRRETMALLGTLFAAALLAGCGGGGGGSDADTAPAPPSPPPVPHAGSGRDCVNPELHKVGTVVRAEYQGGGGIEGGKSLYEYAVKREASFNGHSGLVEVELKMTATEPGQPPRSGVQYLYERLGDSSAFRYGMVIPVVTGQGLPDMTLTTVYDPPVEFRSLALGVGESYVIEWHATTTVTGGPAGEPPVKESDSWTETYLGQETITVPAGTFTTCKIRQHVPGRDGETINWVAKGSGLGVRDVHREGGQESLLRELLPGATINGQPIRIE